VFNLKNGLLFKAVTGHQFFTRNDIKDRPGSPSPLTETRNYAMIILTREQRLTWP